VFYVTFGNRLSIALTSLYKIDNKQFHAAFFRFTGVCLTLGYIDRPSIYMLRQR